MAIPFLSDFTGKNATFAGVINADNSTTNSLDILNLKSGADNVDEYLGLTFTTGVGGDGPHGAIRVYNGPSASDSYMALLTTTDGGTLTKGLTLDHLGAATFISSVIIPDYISHMGDTDTKIGFGPSDNTVELRCGGNLQINFNGRGLI